MKVLKNELYHHGILGQRWGKKNGPPYPLSYGKHSSAEKKANSKGSLSGYTDSNGKQSLAKYKTQAERRHQRFGSDKKLKTDSQEKSLKKASGSVSGKKMIGSEKNYKSEDDFRRDVLKKNPNAAIVGPGSGKASSKEESGTSKAKQWIKDHKKEIAIGVGVAAVAAGAVIGAKYVKNQKRLKLQMMNADLEKKDGGTDEKRKSCRRLSR